MKFVPIAKQSIKRLKVDGVIIVGCDLATAALLIVIANFILLSFDKIATILSSVILNTQLMASNPSIIQLNISLFKQAGAVATSSLLVLTLVFALGISALNYVQWATVAKQQMSKKKALKFILTESAWFFVAFLFTVLLFFSIVEPSRFNYWAPVIFFLLCHLTLSLHIGLMTKRSQLHSVRKIPHYLGQVFSPALKKFWMWVLAYSLIIGIGFVSLILGALFLQVGLIAWLLVLLLAIFGLAWWRMMMFELLTR